MKNKIVKVDYQGLLVSFDTEAWFNATEAAERFGKRPVDWLRLPDTEKYLSILCRRNEVGKSHFVKTRKGGNTAMQGTWLHPSLAVIFARWLDMEFAVWCDEQIYAILKQTHPHYDHVRARSMDAAGYKVVSETLMVSRKADGKDTLAHHYMAEAKLMNWVLVGKFEGLDRDLLSLEQLTLLGKLQVENTVLIARGFGYAVRKTLLYAYAQSYHAGALASTMALERLPDGT